MTRIPTFSTLDEAIARLIIEPIEATGVVTDARAEYDVDAIADELLVFDDAYDAERDAYMLNAQGWRPADDYLDLDDPTDGDDPSWHPVIVDELFWDLVRANER